MKKQYGYEHVLIVRIIRVFIIPLIRVYYTCPSYPSTLVGKKRTKKIRKYRNAKLTLLRNPPRFTVSFDDPRSIDVLAVGTFCPPTPTNTLPPLPLLRAIAPSFPPCSNQGATEPGGLCGFPLNIIEISDSNRWISHVVVGWRGVDEDTRPHMRSDRADDIP